MPITRATTDDDDWRLRVAEYVVINSPVWTEPGELLPSARKDPTTGKLLANKFTAQQLVGGRFIIDESQQEITRGQTYAYPIKDGVQGLSKMSSSQGDPPLYAVMAPDQFLADNLSLDEIDKQIILNLISESFPEDNIENISSQLNVLTFENGQKFYNALYNLIESNFQNPEHKEKKENILKDRRIIDLMKECNNRSAKEHTKAIQAQVGQPYIAISFIKPRASEINGFGLDEKQPTEQSNTNAYFNSEDKGPTFRVYENASAAISKHIVIQSHMDSDASELPDELLVPDNAGKMVREEQLTIDGNTIEKILEIYEHAKQNNIPIVVNCTDGIDRTGVMLFALAILKHADQNPDFLNQSEAEQQHKLLEIYNDLKEDRGYAFLRREQDIPRGVTLGYTLIAAKQAKAEPNNEVAQQERAKAELQFRIANHENSKYSKAVGAYSEYRAPEIDPRKLIRLEEATPEELQSLRDNHIDVDALTAGRTMTPRTVEPIHEIAEPTAKSNPLATFFKTAISWVQEKVSNYLAERKAWHEERKRLLEQLDFILKGINELKKSEIKTNPQARAKLSNYVRELQSIDQNNKSRSFNVMAYVEVTKSEITKLVKQLPKKESEQPKELSSTKSKPGALITETNPPLLTQSKASAPPPYPLISDTSGKDQSQSSQSDITPPSRGRSKSSL